MNGKDLVVLVADKNMEHAVKGLLTRRQSLEIRPIAFDIFVHPERDPGCALRGVEFLSNFSDQYDRALLMFDHEGSGRESVRREELQENLNQQFAGSAWGERARALALSPELEAWVWSPSPHVADVIGWRRRFGPLRLWLTDQNWLREGEMKPKRPKEAFMAALRHARTPRSSSLYQQIAEEVSLRRCVDASFLEFKEILREWFPIRRATPTD